MSTAIFDYASVTREVAGKLRDRASKISSLNARATETILAVGRELILAKAQIEHGDFECWVETEARISIRAAQHYMAVARFADEENKSATIALFAPATAYRLVSKTTPPQIRAEILERAESGDIVPDNAITDMIRRANFEKEQARAPVVKARQRTESKKRREEQLRQQQQHEARQQREQEEIQESATAFLTLVDTDTARGILEALGDGYVAIRVIQEIRSRIAAADAAAAATTTGTASDFDIPSCLARRLAPTTQRG